MSSLEQKKILRKAILLQRKGLSTSEIEKDSAIICDYIIDSSEYRNAYTVMLYSAINSEVSLQKLIHHSLEIKKRVLLPVCIDNKKMDAYEITELNNLVEGMYGISEPDVNICKRVDSHEIDFIAVPGVAFDKNLNRLGRGAGYYDNFLLDADKAFILGIGFGFQLLDKLPIHTSDYKMDAMVCETGIYRKAVL